ncbi:hypothetical protein M770_33690 (plasmid) [Pseudomonas aeruginosa VRFPA03]|nr:hypothetical protein M770_33690 [Pseudomonas aeruginosa VRFPA03]
MGDMAEHLHLVRHQRGLRQHAGQFAGRRADL